MKGVAGGDKCQPVLGGGVEGEGSLITGGVLGQRGCSCCQPRGLGLVLPEDRQAP